MDKIVKNILTEKNPQFLFDFLLAIEVFSKLKYFDEKKINSLNSSTRNFVLILFRN